MRKGKFIYTDSVETRDVLTNAGYPLLKQMDSGWVFVDIGKLTFSTLSNVVFKNTLTF